MKLVINLGNIILIGAGFIFLYMTFINFASYFGTLGYTAAIGSWVSLAAAFITLMIAIIIFAKAFKVLIFKKDEEKAKKNYKKNLYEAELIKEKARLQAQKEFKKKNK